MEILLDLKRSCSNRAVAQASLYSDCLNRLGPRAGEQNTVTSWIDGRTRRRSTSIKCVVNRRSGGAAQNVHGNFLRKSSTIRKDKGLRNSGGRSWRGCRGGGRRRSWRWGRCRGGSGCWGCRWRRRWCWSCGWSWRRGRGIEQTKNTDSAGGTNIHFAVGNCRNGKLVTGSKLIPVIRRLSAIKEFRC